MMAFAGNRGTFRLVKRSLRAALFKLAHYPRLTCPEISRKTSNHGVGRTASTVSSSKKLRKLNHFNEISSEGDTQRAFRQRRNTLMGEKVPMETRGWVDSRERKDPDDRRPLPNPGNGAREAVINWMNGHAGDNRTDEDLTDSLLGHLWLEGFKIIPLDSMEDLVARIREPNAEELEWAKKRAKELGLLDKDPL